MHTAISQSHPQERPPSRQAEQTESCNLIHNLSIQYKVHQPAHKLPHFLHFHDYFEIVFYISSDNTIVVDGAHYPTAANDLIVIGPRRIHTTRYVQDCPYVRYNLYFSEAYVLQTLTAMGVPDATAFLASLRHPKTTLTPSQASRMMSLFSQLYACSDKRMKTPETPMLTLGYACIIITEIYRLFHNKQVAWEVQEESTLRRVIDYMEQHYHERILLDAVARTFFISKYHLCRMFKQSLDCTFSQYLQFIRVTNAQRRLLETDDAISSICYDCGFNSTQHFYRVFRHHLGYTPAAYRKVRMSQKLVDIGVQ